MTHRNRYADVLKLRRALPDAQDIRYEGDLKCPSCKCQRLYSYILPQFHKVKDGQESCGHFCVVCSFGGSTSRVADDGGEQ